MLWFLVIFPAIFMVIVITIAILLGKRDRKREAKEQAEKKKDMLETNPKQAVIQYLDNIRHISEYTFIDVKLNKSKYDCLFLSRKGLFIIYVLANEGIVNGDVNEENWLNKTHDEYVLKNPMFSNKRDIEDLSNVSTLRTDIYSLTVFTRASEVNVINGYEEYQAVKLSELKQLIDSYPDAIDENDLVIYYNNIVNGSHEDEL